MPKSIKKLTVGEVKSFDQMLTLLQGVATRISEDKITVDRANAASKVSNSWAGVMSLKHKLSKK